ncbi:enoyl-CoA hydratase/isomerase family protein [Salinifilum aidingensis]
MPKAEMDTDLLVQAGVDLAVQQRHATITLNRPETRNAQTPLTWRALREVGAHLDPEVRVVVVRGTGGVFSAGLDQRLLDDDAVEGMAGLADLVRRPTELADGEIETAQQGFTWLHDPERLTIAAVGGPAVGAGLQLALACDLRILSEEAWMRVDETEQGLVPDLGGTRPLVQTVGYARAVELCVTGREVPAREAERIGLANAVVPPEQFDGEVDRLVAAACRLPDTALRETLALLSQDADEAVDPEQQLAAERAAQLRCIGDLAERRGWE